MNRLPTQPEDLSSRYRRAFDEYGARALGNMHAKPEGHAAGRRKKLDLAKRRVSHRCSTQDANGVAETF